MELAYRDLFARVTRLRAEAFELVQELERDLQADDTDARRRQALVHMQTVANALGAIQADLSVPRCEPVRVLDL